MDASFLTIAILIAGLGSDDFRVREHCHRHLVKSGSAAMMQLQVAAKSKDRERATRAGQIIYSWRLANKDRMAATFLPPRHVQFPWILCTMAEVDGDCYLAIARRRGFATTAPDWEDYREATRLAVGDLWSDGMPDSEIRRLLNCFRFEERRWLESCSDAVTHRPHDLPD